MSYFTLSVIIKYHSLAILTIQPSVFSTRHNIRVHIVCPVCSSQLCIYNTFSFPPLIQLLQRDPTERLGCIEDREPIRGHPFFKEIDFIKLEAGKLKPPFKPSVV